MAQAVLGDKVTNVCTKTHVGYCVLERTPFSSWEAFEKYEALAVEKVFSKSPEDFTQVWKREV
jgi:hypothetical protein